ncbi:MAG TPA: acetyl-CoA carboxylase biotin carboxyl carrier protein [Candidatus Acidoferrales bacterium]|jgi:acetyl-CoA carboxylase biotin carboxyl carrier protein|nr:acetyl-CoA carboxylase biotin carboxyl carrier protein [Candidatus Acidoferrales bacterium]
MTLTAKDVAEILRLLESSTFDSLSLEIDGVKLHLQRGSAAPVRSLEAPASASQSFVESQPVQSAARRAKPASEPGLADIASPLLGIFYRAPKPGEPPFVEVGSKVGQETVVGIIEVMKLMNSVHAGVKGEVVEILGANGALVEYGEVLLRVRPEGKP